MNDNPIRPTTTSALRGAWRPRRRLGSLVGAAAGAALVLMTVAPTTSGAASPSSGAQLAGAAATAPRPTATAASDTWRAGWSMAPSGSFDTGCDGCTIRNVVHTTAAGRQLRIRLSNDFGTQAVRFAGTSVALAATPGSPQAVPTSVRQLRFGGRVDVTVPQGSSVVSDPVRLTVDAGQDLLVSTYVPGRQGWTTEHAAAMQTSFIGHGGAAVLSAKAADFPERTDFWHYVSGVDVLGARIPGTVVAFGDSITDGVGSTPGLNHRWPNFLASRLQQQRRPFAVANAGISANRVLLDGWNAGQAGVTRFQRDVLELPGVRSVIILLGINDIQQEPHQTDATKIIAGLQGMAEAAHAQGVRVVGATLTPFEGWWVWNPELEAARQAVNEWIRTTEGYDSYVDFDAVVRDPQAPTRMAPVYDSGDHLHPGDAGYAAMADAIDLASL